jgi:hypothetical protein
MSGRAWGRWNRSNDRRGAACSDGTSSNDIENGYKEGRNRGDLKGRIAAAGAQDAVIHYFLANQVSPLTLPVHILRNLMDLRLLISSECNDGIVSSNHKLSLCRRDSISCSAKCELRSISEACRASLWSCHNMDRIYVANCLRVSCISCWVFWIVDWRSSK